MKRFLINIYFFTFALPLWLTENIFFRNMAVRCRRWTWWRTVHCKLWQVVRDHHHLQNHRSCRLRRWPRRRRAWGNDRAPYWVPRSRWPGSYVANTNLRPIASIRSLMATEVKFLYSISLFLLHFFYVQFIEICQCWKKSGGCILQLQIIFIINCT